MADEKDRIQQAADALDALGQNDQAGEPVADAPAAPPAPQPPAAPPTPAAPAAPPVPPAAAASKAVRVVVKAPGPTGARPPAPAAEKKPLPAPPPPLTPLARAALNRKVAFRRTVIPILLTTGLLMVLLGCWAILVLAAGTDPLKGEVTFQTRFLARLMLLAWPIAAVLLGGTGFLMYEVYTHYRMYPSQEAKTDARVSKDH